MAKIPFGWLPGHWGLKGKTKERARIEYEIDDLEIQERELAKLEHRDDERELAVALLKIDLKYGKIKKYDYEIKLAELCFDTDSKALAHRLLHIDFESNKIDNHEYEKRLANINEEPWVAVKNSEFDVKEGPGGLTFELDWNEHFIKFLNDNGFAGISDEAAVDAWFNELCKSIIAEEEQGGAMDALQAQIQARQPGGAIVNKTDLDDNNTEYS